jgi:hypothetical protein
MRLRIGLTAVAVGLIMALTAPPAGAATAKFTRLQGFKAPGTPAYLNKVGVLKVGPQRARNILVLHPGTSASAAYFRPLADLVVARANRKARKIKRPRRRSRRLWQVWAIERRENLLEDHSVFNRLKAREVTSQRSFDYYLGWIEDPTIEPHFQPIGDDGVAFARRWGMNVAMQDARRVIRAARRGGRRVVLGGHSLGGSMTIAYATWSFGGKPGGRDLSGLILIDGGSGPGTAPTAAEARQELADLETSSPWLVFGGIPSPFTGLFNTGGALQALIDPTAPSLGQASSLVPDSLKPPCNATNLSQYGYALDTETSPAGLAAAQAHLGRLDQSTDPCGWDQAGEITPIRRYARMFAGLGLRSLDGTAWYHPLRLSIDSGAVNAGIRNPAQRVLNVRARFGRRLRMPIYAFEAALGDGRVVPAALALARQSRIPRRKLALVDRSGAYAHNDPAGAFPANAFVRRLLPFLRKARAHKPARPKRKRR